MESAMSLRSIGESGNLLPLCARAAFCYAAAVQLCNVYMYTGHRKATLVGEDSRTCRIQSYKPSG
jgi:hypothetical protein